MERGRINGRWGRGRSRQARGWQRNQGRINTINVPPRYTNYRATPAPPCQSTTSNPQKRYLGWDQCWTHGYDVDHDEYICPDPRDGHIPNLTREMIYGNKRVYSGCSLKRKHILIQPDTPGEISFVTIKGNWEQK